MNISNAVREIISRSPDETHQVARMLAGQVGSHALLALHGELGSGKTCFVQGLARALGVRQLVTSPTFTVVNEYAGRVPLYHIDLYRLRGPEEAAGLGLEEYWEADGITVIEWAERAGDLLPVDRWDIRFEILPDTQSRRISIDRPGG